MTRRRWLGVFVLLALGLLVALPGLPSGAASPRFQVDGPLTVTAPASAAVGTAVAITVRGALPDGTPVTLVAVGTWGPVALRANASGGAASFALAAEQARKAGVVTLVATAGGARGEAQLTLIAGAAVEPIVPLVGPRSIVANGEDWTMITVVPQDIFGNPLATGTPVQVNARHPVGANERREVTIDHLLAWARVDSRTRAGQSTIAVAVGGVPGPEAAYQEIPGWPAALELRAEPATLPADGRQYVTLRTAILRDRFDNLVADGTLVTFILESADGEYRAIPANTVGGVALAQVQAPTAPTTFAARVTLPGLESAPIQVAFTSGPATGTIAVVARSDRARGVLVLDAGPILSEFGGYVPDGTVVTVRLIDSRGQVTTQEMLTLSGHATLDVRLAGLTPGAYTIEAVAGSGRGTAEVVVP